MSPLERLRLLVLASAACSTIARLALEAPSPPATWDDWRRAHGR
jgi:hypothetical protein